MTLHDDNTVNVFPGNNISHRCKNVGKLFLKALTLLWSFENRLVGNFDVFVIKKRWKWKKTVKRHKNVTGLKTQNVFKSLWCWYLLLVTTAVVGSFMRSVSVDSADYSITSQAVKTTRTIQRQHTMATYQTDRCTGPSAMSLSPSVRLSVCLLPSILQ